METRANYVLIGLFTLAGIILAIGGVIWLAKYEVDKTFAYYDIYFDDVSGLSRAGDVRYNGIPIGQVVDMELDKNQPGRVRVRIEVGADTPVTEDTVAQLQSQGVTGVSYVALAGGTPESQPLKAKDGAKYGAIKSERSALQDLFKSAPELLNKAIVLLEDVNEMVDDENKQAVKNILANLDQASGNLNDSLASFNALSTELQKLAQTVVNMREQFENVLGSADTALIAADDTLKTAQKAISRIDNLVESEVAPLLSSVRESAGLLDGLFDQVSTLATGATDTLASVKKTFDAAGGTLGNLDETLGIAGETIGIAGETLTAARETFTSANKIIDENLPPLLENASRAAANFDQVAARAVQIIDRDVAPMMTTIRGAVEKIDGVFTTVGDSLTGLTADASTALTSVNEVFVSAKTTLALLDESLIVAKGTLASAGVTFDAANRIMNEDIDAILADLSSTAGNINIAVAKVSGVFETQVPALATDLQAAARRANNLMGNLDRIVVENRKTISTFMRTGLTQFIRFIQEGRALIQTLERVAGKIDSDPARFLFGTQSPEYAPQ